MPRYFFRLALVPLLWLSLNQPSFADAGWITTGGSPHLMKDEHKTVKMKSETVDIHITKKLVHVDCTFHFKNEGPACSVTMGFPDAPLDAGNEKYYPMFSTYHSYENGIEVPTKTEHDEKGYIFWHTQIVDFPANSAKIVRDVYEVPAGFSPVSANGARRAFMYLFYTGASWHGRIGKAIFNITFDEDVVKQPLKAIGRNEKTPSESAVDRFVKYEASTTPTVNGNKITFSYSNIEPKEDDNLAFEFGDELSEKQAIETYIGIVHDFIQRNSATLTPTEAQNLQKQCDDALKNSNNAAR